MGAEGRSELARFTSAALQRHLLRRPDQDKPEIEELPGAVMLVDVSAVTALTGRLVGGGGASEEVARELDACFGRIFDLIHEHGGDVLSIASDSLLAVWHAPEPDMLPGATLRAAACAVTACEELEELSTRDGAGIRIAVNSGRVLGAYLGGVDDRWELVMLGGTTRAAAAILGDCAPGSVVLGTSAWTIAGAYCVGQEVSEGAFRLDSVVAAPPPVPMELPELDERTEEALAAFVPPSVVAGSSTGQQGWLAEIRRVTVVCAIAPGDDRGLALDSSNMVVRKLQALARRYEGTLHGVRVTSAFVRFLLVQGMPPRSHADDAARALEIGLAIDEVYRGAGFPCSVGVASGRAFCGVIGGAHRSDYTMLGVVAGTAERLAHTQDSGVVCDEATRGASRDRFDFVALRELPADAGGPPVVAHRVDGRRQAQTRQAQFACVGRVAEREALGRYLEALVAGTPSRVVLEGEAGIGKSRVIEDLEAKAEGRVTLLVGAADAIERSTAYLAWKGVLTSLLGLKDAAEPAERERRLREHLADRPELLELAPLLGPLVSLDLADTDATRPLDGDARATTTRRLICQLLQDAAAQRPILLILDDTHWMDSASWPLVRDVAMSGAPIMLLLATRPLGDVPMPLDYQWLLAAEGTEHFVLEPLGAEHAGALVCQRLGVSSIPAELVDLLAAKAHGNPFFTEELAYSLRDAGLIEVADGECRVAQGVDLSTAAGVPDTVEGVVTQRIDRLDATQQLALKVASVVGRVFTLRMVKGIFPLEEMRGELQAHLDTLRVLDFTAPENTQSDLAYIFKHIITQEVVYELMLPAQRRDLHGSIARWYEASFDDLAPYYPLLARHWSRAEDVDKAIEFHLLAGEQALRGASNREAITFFEEAQRLDGSRPGGPDAQRAAICALRLGVANFRLNRYARAEVELKRGLALLGAPGPVGKAATMRALLRQFLLQAARRWFPGRFITMADEEERGRVRDIADSYRQLAFSALNRAAKLDVLLAGLQQLNTAERLGPSTTLDHARANMSIVAHMVGFKSAAADYARLARGALERQALGPVVPRVYSSLAVYRVISGDFPGAVQDFDQMVEISDRLGDQRTLREGLTGGSSSAFRCGDFVTAARYGHRLHEIGMRNDNPMATAHGLAVLIRLQLPELGPGRSDRTAELEQVLGAERSAEEIPRGERVGAYGALAWGCWLLGEEDAALRHVGTIVDLLAIGQPAVLLEVVGMAAGSDILLARWERAGELAPGQREQLNVICQEFDGYGEANKNGRCMALRRRGVWTCLDGKPSKGLKLLRQALEAAQATAMRLEEASCHHELGKRLPAGAEKEAHLAKARALYDELGLPFERAALDAGAGAAGA